MTDSGGDPAFYFFGGEFLISRDWRINDEIRAREIRLIDENGEQAGIVNVRDALMMATERGLDLVEIAPGAKPPVCRLMDYGKFRYEQSKRDKEARKKQKVITVKELKMRPRIDDHDFNVKNKNARKFLQEGDKVKVTIMFKGREMSHADIGMQLCHQFAEELKDIALVEKEPKVEGRNMTMILVPRTDSARSDNAS